MKRRKRRAVKHIKQIISNHYDFYAIIMELKNNSLMVEEKEGKVKINLKIA